MNRRWLIPLLVILSLLMVYELFNSRYSFMLILIGIVSLVFRKHLPRKWQKNSLFISILSLSLALFSSRLLLAFLVIGILLFIGENPESYGLIREVLSKKSINRKANDFIFVDFEKVEGTPAKITKNRWLGEDTNSADSIYSWEDINFSKIIGNTVFDLGNTILPKEQNIILIRKGIGNTKILIPEGIAVSIDVSMLIGKVTLKQEELTLKNETFKWQTDKYFENKRKIKIISNSLVGEFEVIFL